MPTFIYMCTASPEQTGNMNGLLEKKIVMEFPNISIHFCWLNEFVAKQQTMSWTDKSLERGRIRSPVYSESYLECQIGCCPLQRNVHLCQAHLELSPGASLSTVLFGSLQNTSFIYKTREIETRRISSIVF